MKMVFYKTKFFISFVLFTCFCSHVAFAKDDKQVNQGYTINYQNVSLVEYVKFVSKIASINFIYNQQELEPYTISVVSDEPITVDSLMSTLIQSLRINGMHILEQDNNFIITKADNVKQLAKVSKENEQMDAQDPILTKVFRIQNTPVESIAAIINSMISESAVLDVLTDTRQIVITDITTNLEKIKSLIENLDSPETPLEIKAYDLKYNQPSYVINLANQLMAPIASGSPFILVPEEESNTIYIVSTPRLVEKATAVFNNLDTESKNFTKGRPLKGENIFIYQPKEKGAVELINALNKISESLKDNGLPDKDLINIIETLNFIPETNSILFTGSATSISKVKEFLATIDTSERNAFLESTTFFIYKPKNISLSSLKETLDEYSDELSSAKYPDRELVEALKNAKMVSSSNSILFTGDPAVFEKVKELISSIDSDTNGDLLSHKKTFWLYKLENRNYSQLIDALKSTAKDLKKAGVAERDLIDTIESVKYMPDTNSLLFTGTESGIEKLKNLMSSFNDENGLLPVSNQFLIYHPTNISGDQVLESLKEIAKNLENSNLADPPLLRAIESGKFVENTESVIFTGDAASLQKIDLLLKDIDAKELYPGSQKKYYIYQLQYVTKERVEQYLNQVVQNLSRSGLKNEPVIKAIKSLRWIPESRSLMFSGNEFALNQVKELLSKFDVPEEDQKHTLSSYYLYKLQNVSGSIIEEDLERFASNLKATGLKDSELITVLDNAKWVKETNSILLTGYPKKLEEAKNIVAQFDVRRDATGAQTDFFMYKPKNIPPEIIQQSLNEIANNLRKSDLSDSALLSVIKSMKYNETTHSFIFTGSADALQKLKVLLENIDDESQRSRIQQIGKTTFLLYKLKSASGTQIQSSIKQITKDLKRSGSGDSKFLEALKSMKYVPETNSLLFTGDPTSLEKVQALVEKFDVPSLKSPGEFIEGADKFFVYKPKFLKGPELQRQLKEFAENLKMTGLTDPRLYQALNNTRWVEDNKSLIITGDNQTIDKVKGLIREIDTPSDGFMLQEPALSPTETTNFLVYKLQFHKGEQIRGALRSIATDLLESKSADKELIETINAIQWIEVTNSLLITGSQSILTRLKELIKSLDIPLKQVFIEVLVIETSLTNTLNFGLDWLSKGKWKDKASTSFGSLPPGAATGPGTFPGQFEQINATTTPVPTDIPFRDGFSLGAIGDVIFHKGRSFVSMGSLMNALQQDNETVIVTTPKVFAQDSKKSNLFIGFNIPFVGSFVQNQGANTVDTTNIEYRDIGVDLEITPVLGNSDVVTLQLRLSRQETTDQQNLVVNNVQGITTSKTSLETTFHVPNKHFLILTGMVTQTKNKSKSGIPCLGGLPLIGAAFSLNSNTENDRNVVIFLKPHIINSLEDMQDVTEKQEDFFREKAGNALLENEVDEAMEMIKSYEDE